MRKSVLILSLVLHGALLGAVATGWPARAGEQRVPARFGLQPSPAEPPPAPPATLPPVQPEGVPSEPWPDLPVTVPVWTEPEPAPPPFAPLPERLPPQLLPVRPAPPPAEVPPDIPPAVAPAPSPTPAAAYVEAMPLVADNRPPEYPERARQLGHQGEVRVAVRVATDGSAAEVWLEAGCPHPELNRAALQAVRGFRFVPATRQGVPEPAVIVVPVVFRLQG